MISMLVEKTVGQLSYDAVTSNLVDCERTVSPCPWGCPTYGVWAILLCTLDDDHPSIVGSPGTLRWAGKKVGHSTNDSDVMVSVNDPVTKSGTLVAPWVSSSAW